MRIGVIGPTGPDRFADNITDALRRGSHDVIQLGPARPSAHNKVVVRASTLVRQALPRFDALAQSQIARKALESDCEIVINVDSRLMPDAVIRLKRAGVRVAFWFPDAVIFLGRQFMILAPYDAVFFKEPHIVDRLRANLDLPVHYLPQGCNPRWHRPLVPPGSEPHIVIAGNMYPSRVRLLERLIAEGIPLKLYGPGFPRWIGSSPAIAAHTGRYLAREDKARSFRAAAAVLNTMHPAEVSGVNVRLFEAAASGAAVLTEYRPTVPDLFKPNEEVLAFHDFDELLEQARRLLSQQGLTARLGNAAAARAHADHSYDRRVVELLEKVC